MLLPTCAQGLSALVVGNAGKGVFLTFWLLLSALCILGVLALLAIPLVCTRLGFQRYASCCTRPEGGVWWGALCLLPLGSLLGSTNNCQSEVWHAL